MDQPDTSLRPEESSNRPVPIYDAVKEVVGRLNRHSRLSVKALQRKGMSLPDAYVSVLCRLPQ